LKARFEAQIPLCAGRHLCESPAVSSASEIQGLALKLPQRSRLKLAIELLRSASPAVSSDEILEEAIRRDAELQSGKVKALDEEEFWSGVVRPGRQVS
jgi:hypothetical protein